MNECVCVCELVDINDSMLLPLTLLLLGMRASSLYIYSDMIIISFLCRLHPTLFYLLNDKNLNTEAFFFSQLMVVFAWISFLFFSFCFVSEETEFNFVAKISKNVLMSSRHATDAGHSWCENDGTSIHIHCDGIELACSGCKRLNFEFLRVWVEISGWKLFFWIEMKRKRKKKEN